MSKAVRAMAATARNRVRIIGGIWRSRVITFPARAGLRPTPDRVRETLFNWLGQNLTGRRCLDLFAGSGALGFEAASRGAAQVVMVDRDREVCSALEKSARALNATQVTIACEDALGFLARDRRHFDVIFLDPPYASNAFVKILPLVPRHLSEEGVLYVESSAAHLLSDDWQVLREQRAGQVRFLIARCAVPAGL
ncbi:MAG: 16S rRNA (guanine(966)-N(2))-methyltransferase RsmD [Burkholderiales bacterium]